MTESKIEITERLRREGRWQLASRYRDRVRDNLKRQGMPRAEAAEEAWKAVAAAYPPLTSDPDLRDPLVAMAASEPPAVVLGPVGGHAFEDVWRVAVNCLAWERASDAECVDVASWLDHELVQLDDTLVVMADERLFDFLNTVALPTLAMASGGAPSAVENELIDECYAGLHDLIWSMPEFFDHLESLEGKGIVRMSLPLSSFSAAVTPSGAGARG